MTMKTGAMTSHQPSTISLHRSKAWYKPTISISHWTSDVISSTVSSRYVTFRLALPSPSLISVYVEKEKRQTTEPDRNHQRHRCRSRTTRNHGTSTVCCCTMHLHREHHQRDRRIQSAALKGNHIASVRLSSIITSLFAYHVLVVHKERQRPKVSVARRRSTDWWTSWCSRKDLQQKDNVKDLAEALRWRSGRRRDILSMAWKGIETIHGQSHSEGNTRDGERVHSMAEDRWRIKWRWWWRRE